LIFLLSLIHKVHADYQKESVLEVLNSLDIDESLLKSKYVEVWNKVDLLGMFIFLFFLSSN
jgi:hypothetical protein